MARIQMMHAGMAAATSAKRVLARVYGLLLMPVEDVGVDRLLWMPAHTSAAQVGKLRLSNGELLTKEDVYANDLSDKGATLAVEEHRVAASEVKAWYDLEGETKERAKWIGKVTSLACNLPEFPFKDNEAARWKVDAARKAKKATKVATERRAPKEVTKEKRGAHPCESLACIRDQERLEMHGMQVSVLIQGEASFAGVQWPGTGEVAAEGGQSCGDLKAGG